MKKSTLVMVLATKQLTLEINFGEKLFSINSIAKFFSEGVKMVSFSIVDKGR